MKTAASSWTLAFVMVHGGSLVFFTILLVTTAGCQISRAPDSGLIEQAYFQCDKCQSLEGGIFGKGPFKRFDGPGSAQCVHHWRRIGRQEFKRAATELHQIDWNEEIPWWSRD